MNSTTLNCMLFLNNTIPCFNRTSGRKKMVRFIVTTVVVSIINLNQNVSLENVNNLVIVKVQNFRLSGF